MTSNLPDLADFGWSAHFAAQLDLVETTTAIPARVMAAHRSGLVLSGPDVEAAAPPSCADPEDAEAVATVGDWLLLDPETRRPMRLLERKSLFKRRAAGTGRALQLIAANVDTLFIVSSCNQDFNLARLERYLALAHAANVSPVIVLTKADLSDEPEALARAATTLSPGLLVELVDARDPTSVETLLPWCGRGQTVALLGSSGVGKSTLVNTLSGETTLATQGVREDDDKGRHTTTGRALHRLPSGGWLMDTPGMRELGLTDAKAGIDSVFGDIVALAEGCRFSDCRHETEPGCAVRHAIETGALEPERLTRWRKLEAEEAYNSESLAERRARERGFTKMVRTHAKARKRRDGD